MTTIATAPLEVLGDFHGFIPWESGKEIFGALFENIVWIDRDKAEESNELFQPIPCAILHDESGNYIVQERIDEARHDMRGRIALTYGGHIDAEDADGAPNLEALSLFTLHRELKEELGIRNVKQVDPIGMIVCTYSPEARRHVALLYRFVITESVSTYATEEFKTDSEHNGDPKSVEELQSLRGVMDPWSRIVLDGYILPNAVTENDGSEITIEEAQIPEKLAEFIAEKNPYAFTNNPQGVIELTTRSDGHMRNVHVVLEAFHQRALRDKSISTEDFLEASDWLVSFEGRFGSAKKIALK